MYYCIIKKISMNAMDFPALRKLNALTHLVATTALATLDTQEMDLIAKVWHSWMVFHFMKWTRCISLQMLMSVWRVVYTARIPTV